MPHLVLLQKGKVLHLSLKARHIRKFYPILFYHPEKPLYQLYNTVLQYSQHLNFYFPILLIKIIYLHNKLYFFVFVFSQFSPLPSFNLYHQASAAYSPPPRLHHAHHATTAHRPPKFHRNKTYIKKKKMHNPNELDLAMTHTEPRRTQKKKKSVEPRKNAEPFGIHPHLHHARPCH